MKFGFVRRLREMVDASGGTRALSRKADLSEKNLTNWLSGEVEPKIFAVAALAEAAGVSLDWLLSGEGRGPDKRMEFGELVRIPLFGPEAWGGSERLASLISRYRKGGGDPNGLHVVGFMAFDSQWLREFLSADPATLALLTLSGDTMEPLIRAGDNVLVDTAAKTLSQDGVYLLGVGAGLKVMRVTLLLEGGVSLKHDNPAYAEQRLGSEGAQQVLVEGRIRWFGRFI